jgi:hypothetical protein
MLDPPEPARANPTLATFQRVQAILEQAEGPLSFAEIARRLPAAKTRPETVKACVMELVRLGFVAVGKKGVLWAYASPETWSRKTERLA